MAKTLVLILVTGLLAVPVWGAPYDEETGQYGSAKRKVETGSPRFPVTALIIVDNSLGAGALVANAYARNILWSASVSLRPTLTLWEKLRLTLRSDINKNLSSSYQGNGNADGSAESYLRQTTVSDLHLIASLPQVFREPNTGVGLGVSVSGYAPISMASRSANLVFALRPGLTLNWGWKGLGINYGLFYKQNFHTTTTATQNVESLPNALMFRAGGAEDLGDGEIAIGSLRNTQRVVYNTLGLSYSFFENWSASATLLVVNSFKYTQPLSDAYSSPYASATGQADMTSGVLDLSYQVNPHLALSLGVSSAQPARTADNQFWRFPFFDFVTPGNNFSAFYFDVVGSL